ncbi:hypothetical protein ACGFJ7_32920 [Actinoplanes sp. NPDC048988]|uniref:hypothetical protein n=1 Tax=Actinoplanes sp. NPDC048988 TaxID=3363901 RepID=UPI00372390F1
MRIRVALGFVDALLITTSLFVICWNLVIQPALAAGHPYAISHPVADVILGTVALCALALVPFLLDPVDRGSTPTRRSASRARRSSGSSDTASVTRSASG